MEVLADKFKSRMFKEFPSLFTVKELDKAISTTMDEFKNTDSKRLKEDIINLATDKAVDTYIEHFTQIEAVLDGVIKGIKK